MTLAHLSDDQILSGIEAIQVEGNRLLARLLLHLVEIYQKSSPPEMWVVTVPGSLGSSIRHAHRFLGSRQRF